MSAMTASERRQQIARLLSASQAPISATTLSQELGVSRQIIVGDIALLRAGGAEISATVAEEAMEYLDAPILRYGAPFCPIPFAPTLEKMVKVVPEDLVKGIKGMF